MSPPPPRLVAVVTMMMVVVVTVPAVSAAEGARGRLKRAGFAGDTCVGDSGLPGECRPVNLCPYAVQQARRGLRTKLCGWRGPTPVVCCPQDQNGTTGTGSNGPEASSVADGDHEASTATTTNDEDSGSIARKKCEEYAKLVFGPSDDSLLFWETEVDMCAVAPAEALVVGGTKAKPAEFPHMALVGYERNNGREIAWKCGGSLIAPDFVLTAAHCLYASNAPASWVLLGDLNVATDEDEASPQRIAVAERIRHPDHKPPSRYNDIALLRLKRHAVMGQYVRPACLHTTEQDKQGGADHLHEDLIITGWGRTQHDGHPSDHLQKAGLDLVGHAACAMAYAHDPLTPRGVLDESQLCAGGRGGSSSSSSSSSGMGACQGDSGGPLQVATAQPYCMYSIVGLSSYGIGCGVTPGVFTRVSHFAAWIESVVWPREQQPSQQPPTKADPVLASAAANPVQQQPSPPSTSNPASAALTDKPMTVQVEPSSGQQEPAKATAAALVAAAITTTTTRPSSDSSSSSSSLSDARKKVTIPFMTSHTTTTTTTGGVYEEMDHDVLPRPPGQQQRPPWQSSQQTQSQDDQDKVTTTTTTMWGTPPPRPQQQQQQQQTVKRPEPPGGYTYVDSHPVWP